MAHFFLKLIPPRPSFPFDITAEERAIMAAHAVYLKGIFITGKLLAYRARVRYCRSLRHGHF